MRLRGMPAHTDVEPHKKLGARTRAALEAMLRSEGVEQATSACTAMAWGTTYSRNACGWVANEGGLPTLLAFLKTCNRSRPHQHMMLAILTILANMLKHGEAALPIAARDLTSFLPVLSDNMQYFRCVVFYRCTSSPLW